MHGTVQRRFPFLRCPGKKSVNYFIIYRSMFSPEIISYNVSENARLPKLRFKDAVEGFEFAMNDRLIDFLEYN